MTSLSCRLTQSLFILAALCATFTVQAQSTRPTTQPANQAALEKTFAELLTGSTLVGRFSTGDANNNPKQERYAISSARKFLGDTWIITARIQYGQRDVTVPVPVTVKFAGDTPMIQLTKTTIPGLGTYSCRVLFYDDLYAGTWAGGEHGGHMWGRIEKAPAPKPDADAPADPAAKSEPK